MTDRMPMTRMFDLGDLSDAGYATTVTASPSELDRLAEWEDVEEVSLFQGEVTLKRQSQTRFLYAARLTVELTQSCVVTLDPVRSHISREFTRQLHYTPARHPGKGGAITLGAAEDEAPEEIDSLKFDLAGPLLEEFSLAIDPYPRAPGVTFNPPEEQLDASENPFAVLKGLKRG
jgi:uncharacterized metal-binding protein YceD (DUF177 family)